MQSIGESGNVGDTYSRLVDVIGLNPVARPEVIEGFVLFQTFGATVVYSQTKPSANATGIPWQAGAGFTLGPRAYRGAGFRLDYYWVKNTTGGNVAVATVQALVELV